ncbi:TetR/AcrR family transcriptional regulator [Paenibacillus sp. GCM10012306]|uniref:TetR/AcrR family transcriptional regulator n=1 Tax=Paenibacillus sp. GCM10012306 TaxID=3317342 RepID=UPI003622FB80
MEVSNMLFKTKGYKGTSIREIAEHSGLAKATIYHYFPDKEAIVQQLLTLTISQFHNVAQSISEITEPRARLTASAEITIAFLYESSSVIQLVRKELPELWNKSKLELLPIYERYLSLLSQAIDQGIEEGTFRPINSQEAAIVLLNLIQGTYASIQLVGLGEKQTYSTAGILDIFFNGIIK